MIRDLRINHQIRAAEVQVIGEDGGQLGTMTVQEALKLSLEKELDLVEVGPAAVPPIVKIMDYGKYLYQKQKQERKSGAAKPKEHEQKTVRVGFKTGAHDIAFKAKQVGEFLTEGHSVKVELTLRGREKGLADMGRQKLIAFLQNIPTPFITHGDPRRSPYGWIVIIQKDKKAKIQKHENQESTIKES